MAPSGTPDLPRLERAVRELLVAVGEDPDREGLVRTPARVATLWAGLLSGVHDDPDRHLDADLAGGGGDDPVVVRDLRVASMCEHHLVPFTGRAHLAYAPADGRVAGLSRFSRLLDGYARRPQLQERLTAQVADAVQRVLRPVGVLVVVEAEHLCMSLPDPATAGSSIATSAVRGAWRDGGVPAEVLRLLDRAHGP